MAGISTACKLQPAMYIKCEYAFHLYMYHSNSITYFIPIFLVLESQASRSQIEGQHIDYLKWQERVSAQSISNLDLLGLR